MALTAGGDGGGHTSMPRVTRYGKRALSSPTSIPSIWQNKEITPDNNISHKKCNAPSAKLFRISIEHAQVCRWTTAIWLDMARWVYWGTSGQQRQRCYDIFAERGWTNRCDHWSTIGTGGLPKGWLITIITFPVGVQPVFRTWGLVSRSFNYFVFSFVCISILSNIAASTNVPTWLSKRRPPH